MRNLKADGYLELANVIYEMALKSKTVAENMERQLRNLSTRATWKETGKLKESLDSKMWKKIMKASRQNYVNT
jgi:uncharacterized protein YajQ (UPF0234 family)